jgi:hypothetical protein
MRDAHGVTRPARPTEMEIHDRTGLEQRYFEDLRARRPERAQEVFTVKDPVTGEDVMVPASRVTRTEDPATGRVDHSYRANDGTVMRAEARSEQMRAEPSARDLADARKVAGTEGWHRIDGERTPRETSRIVSSADEHIQGHEVGHSLASPSWRENLGMGDPAARGRGAGLDEGVNEYLLQQHRGARGAQEVRTDLYPQRVEVARALDTLANGKLSNVYFHGTQAHWDDFYRTLGGDVQRGRAIFENVKDLTDSGQFSQAELYLRRLSTRDPAP